MASTTSPGAIPPELSPLSASLARLCHTGCLQVLYKEQGSEGRAQFWLAEGNASRSAQLTGLAKYTLYEIRVLAFTRIGDGVPSRPPVLERTLDDGG